MRLTTVVLFCIVLSVTISISTGMAVKEPNDENSSMGDKKWEYPKSCCSHLTKCPFKGWVKRVGRVFTPHFWKRHYHKIVHGKDIGACDPNDCRCATLDDQHNCEQLGHQCPCTQQKASKK
uniref:Uncharacterized protein n=1 Tax=Cacopsylla melanoneura TaxID=428564 RepID=A0A8D8YML4_9HEMI